MRRISDLKGAGYLTSTGSVFLLGAAAWNTAAQSTVTTAFLILGMLLSVVGMLLRWRSHHLEQKQRN